MMEGIKIILVVVYAIIAIAARSSVATPTFDPRFAASRSTVAKEAGVR